MDEIFIGGEEDGPARETQEPEASQMPMTMQSEEYPILFGAKSSRGLLTDRRREVRQGDANMYQTCVEV